MGTKSWNCSGEFLLWTSHIFFRHRKVIFIVNLNQKIIEITWNYKLSSQPKLQNKNDSKSENNKMTYNLFLKVLSTKTCKKKRRVAGEKKIIFCFSPRDSWSRKSSVAQVWRNGSAWLKNGRPSRTFAGFSTITTGFSKFVPPLSIALSTASNAPGRSCRKRPNWPSTSYRPSLRPTAASKTCGMRYTAATHPAFRTWGCTWLTSVS